MERVRPGRVKRERSLEIGEERGEKERGKRYILQLER
jgi:hypothetical protein